MWIAVHNFLFDIKVGDFYKISTDKQIECVKRTKKQIHLSNGEKITIKKIGNLSYLTSRSFKIKNKTYNKIDGILRDVEGYLIYKKLTNDGI